MFLIEGYCVVLLMIVAIAGVLEGQPALMLSKQTRGRIAVRLGHSGKRHIYREQHILDILKQIGA